jgi:hypothetical protein
MSKRLIEISAHVEGAGVFKAVRVAHRGDEALKWRRHLDPWPSTTVPAGAQLAVIEHPTRPLSGSSH